MPKAIPKGLKRGHVLKALKFLDAGNKHPFGKQKRYSALHHGKQYAPKAAVGVAFKFLTGSILPPREFSGGIQPGQANHVLQTLGFEVLDSHDSGRGDLAEKLAEISRKAEKEDYFQPKDLNDERERRLREIVQRRGQPEFRNKLIAAYDGRCAITDCDAVSPLEAAHITPYAGPKSHHVSNGILLRADIHTLFDLDLIGIHPETLQVVLAAPLRETCYAETQDRRLTTPDDPGSAPSQEALRQRWDRFNGKGECGGT